jgi:pilus assembly protein CpaC
VKTAPHGVLVLLFIGAQLICGAAQDDRAELVVTVNKSIVLETEASVKRLSTANGDVAEAVAVSAREIVINGRLPGETSIILWDADGKRKIYDVHVLANQTRVEAVRRQLAEELPGQDVTLDVEDGSSVLRGYAKDVPSAERAVAIGGLIGKVTNLLHVIPPPPEPQILLRVRFANVDRSATSELAANLFSTGATNTIGNISTGQYPSPPSLFRTLSTFFSIGKTSTWAQSFRLSKLSNWSRFSRSQIS